MAARVDAHCHYWSLARADYGWLTPALAPIHRDFGATDHDRVSKAHGVAARILVQAAPTVEETRYLLDCAATDPKAAAVVGWVDLASPESVDILETLARNPAFKGVRPMLQDLADPDWIATAPHPQVLAALGWLGLRFDALVKPENLAGLLRFIHANPGLPVMIDHAAKPPLAAPEDDPRHTLWAEGMAALAAFPQVSCKLSGLLTEMEPAQRQTPESAARVLAPLFDRLLDWFGPERLAWGSDWPVLNLAADYRFWVATTDILLAPLGTDARAAILSGTATRFYGLAEDPA